MVYLGDETAHTGDETAHTESWDLSFRSWLIPRLFIEGELELKKKKAKPIRRNMSDTNELMEFISTRVGTTLDKIYQRLVDCKIALEDP